MLLMALLYLLINKTKLGMVIRATAQDYEAAYAMGVGVNGIFMVAFAIGSMLGGVAGVLVGVYYNLFYPTMGGLYGLKAFSASVVGGLTSLPGAVVAGLHHRYCRNVFGGIWRLQFSSFIFLPVYDSDPALPAGRIVRRQGAYSGPGGLMTHALRQILANLALSRHCRDNGTHAPVYQQSVLHSGTDFHRHLYLS